MLKVNEYFKGAVKSISLQNSAGNSSVGVISPGEFEFSTSSLEVMTVVTGKLDVKIPGSNDWRSFTPGSSFTIQSGSKFRVRTNVDTAYLCLYK